jgi:cardiolipin synthase
MERVVLQAVHLARRSIVVTTPYFVPDDALVDALCTAAYRGVAVRLVLPMTSDAPVVQAAGRSRYGDLLEAGIEIFEFTEGLLHAKTITVDGDFALMGSANLDIRSFMLNFEVSLLVYDENFASQVHFLQSGYVERSRPVDLHAWRRRGAWQILVDNISKLMSPIL